MSEAAKNNEMSKSKKKRMKRKAAKDRKQQNEEDNNNNNNKQGDGNSNGTDSRLKDLSTLTPHEKLCHDLMQNGYDRETIEVALGEMWDMGLEYDSYGSALTYLKGREAQKRVDAERKETAAAAVAVVEAQQEPPKPEPTAAVPPPMSMPPTVAAAPSKTKPAATAESSSQQPAVGATALASKLDVVANFPDLHDAVLALSEWTTKAAKPSELMELCTQGTAKPPAIYTIILRSINCEVDSEFRSLLPPLKTVVATLVGKKTGDVVCSSFTDILAYVRDTVEHSRSHAMPGVDLAGSTAHSFAAQICESLASARETVAAASAVEITTPHYKDEEEKSAAIRTMESEIDDLLARQPVGNADGVVGLMTRRDCRKVAAEKAAAVTALLLEDRDDGAVAHYANGNGHAGERGGSAKRLDADALLTNLFDGHHTKFQRNRSLFADLENRMSDSVQQRTRLQGDLDVCAAEVKRVRDRKQALQNELTKVDRELDNVVARQAQLREALDRMMSNGKHSGRANDGADGLQNEHRERAEYIKMEDRLTSLVDRLVSLEEALVPKVTPVQKSSRNNRTQMVLESIQTESKLENFFILAKNYFSTEADCVDFMRNRVVGLEIEARDLQREISECTALGMATSVSKMTDGLETIRGNILEDQGVISALQGEAETMRNVLVERTKDFMKLSPTSTMSDLAPSSQLGTHLGGIGAYLTRIGIDASNPLFTGGGGGGGGSVMATTAAEQTHKSQQQPIANRNSSNEVPNPIKANRQQQQQQAIPTPPEPAASMPKFSWGGRASTNKKNGKSLVDIQKEELTKQGQ